MAINYLYGILWKKNDNKLLFYFKYNCDNRVIFSDEQEMHHPEDYENTHKNDARTSQLQMKIQIGKFNIFLLAVAGND